MQTLNHIAGVRGLIREWRQAGQRIGFVPTMGNLHAGHLQLLTAARQATEKTVVSIFVNPTQFGPGEDFAGYPRTEAEDATALLSAGADLLFLPTAAEMYPQAAATRVSVPALAGLHCGASRPGHFDGVALVVCKLLNIVQPDLLLLGEKDFQQLAIIRRMAADLNIDTEIRGMPTVRESDGLAMSSRNGYLNAAERRQAPLLYQALCAARDAILAGEPDYAGLTNRQSLWLESHGFAVDYFHISRSRDLLPAGADDAELVILTAARLGRTRLIDNVQLRRVCRSLPPADRIAEV